MSKLKKAGLWAGGILVALTILGAILPAPKDQGTTPKTVVEKAAAKPAPAPAPPSKAEVEHEAVVRNLMPEKYQRVEEASQFRCEAEALRGTGSIENVTASMEACR